MLGLTRHVALAKDEGEVLASLDSLIATNQPPVVSH